MVQLGQLRQRARTQRSRRLLQPESLERRILLAAVVSEIPNARSHNAPVATDVSATFDETITIATSQSFSVKSRQAGIAEGTIAISGTTVTLDTPSSFFPGDVVEVSATSDIQGATAGVPRVWQFRTATSTAGAAELVDSGQNLGVTAARDIEFGDIDRDGDLDAIESGEYSMSIWFNDGSGTFTNGQLIAGNNQEIELGDVDSDGDLDIVSTNGVFLNDSSGVFSDAGQGIGGFLRSIALGDIDGDGDLDALRGVPYGGDRVWLNNGSGVFTNTGQVLGFATSDSIQLGDLDHDGDLDAFTVYYGADNRVWVNNGSGVFTDSGQAIGGFSASKDVDLGDLDGDGDLDAFIANDASTNIPSQVWLNDGSGQFTDSGQALGATENNWSLELGDLDGDGDLDAFVSTLHQASRVWLNDGAAGFTDSGQSIATATRETIHVALGDVDGDGDLDAWEANNSQISRLIINVDPNPDVTLTVDNPTIPEANGVATFTANLSAAATVPVTINLAISGTASASDFSASTTQIVIAPGATSGSITITAVQDEINESDETLVVDVTDVTNGNESGEQQATTTIVDDDESPLRALVATPPPNSHSAAKSSDVSITFDGEVDGNAATPQNFVVHSGQRGQLVGAEATVTATGDTIRLDPTTDLFPGELIQAIGTSAINGPGGEPAIPFIWQFRTAVTSGNGDLLGVEQDLGNHRSRGVELGDLDNDGDLDAFVVNIGNQPNRIWINQGGQFSDSGQLLGNHNSRGIALGDVDGDGDLDAFVANRFQANRVWINDGGTFSDSGQSLGDQDSYSVALGDVDGDGDLDAFVANLHQANQVWINDNGLFSNNGQNLGDHRSERASLGDLDGDGDLDAFIGNSHQGNRIWLNDGGLFTDSGQSMGDHDSCGSALGDLDGDGDLDAFVANSYEGNRIWLNDGNGVLVDSGQSLGDHDSWGIALGDLDSDGDLDAIVADFNEGNRVWLNDGGVFSDSGLSLGDHLSFDVSVGDLDGDGDLDAFVVNRDQGNRVWLNPQNNALLTVSALDANKNEGNAAQTPFTFEVQRTGESSAPSTVNYAVVGSGDHPANAADFGGTFPSGVVNFAAGETTQTITIEVSGDSLLEESEGFTLTLSEPSPATTQIVAAVAAGTIEDDDTQPLIVTSLTPTSSGFIAEFNLTFDSTVLNLHDLQAAGLGAADVVLRGETSGLVPGSLVLEAVSRTITFVRTGDPLQPDIYTVTLRSAIDGFRDVTGSPLDGNGDGVVGDDFQVTFAIAPPPGNAVEIGLPDFERGAGQEVNVPADNTLGIPLTIRGGNGVRHLVVPIDYDPTLLSITSASVGSAMPPGSTASLDLSTAGTLTVTFTSPTDLPSELNDLVNLRASIPTTDFSLNYGRQQLLDVHDVIVRDADENPIPAIVDDAVHLAAYFGDVSGNGRVNGSDAAQVARIAALLETSFGSALLTDPSIIGDISGNGRINAADASLVAQFAALIAVPEIPPIPAGVIAVDGQGTLAGSSLLDVVFTKQPIVSAADQASEVWIGAAAEVPRLETTAPYQAVDRVLASLFEDAFDQWRFAQDDQDS